MPTPATVDSILRCVSVSMDRVSLAFTVLLSTMVLTVSLNVFTSTPTPMPASSPPAPVPVASFTLSSLAVFMFMVSAVNSLPAIRLVTWVSILFTAILLATPPLNKPAATPTETSWASSVVLLAALTDRFDLAVTPVAFFMSLLATLAVTEDSSFTTPTPTFSEPATPASLAAMAEPASTFRL